MAAQDFNATTTPRDIVDELGLVVGTRYTIQNVSTVATLRFREAVTPPSPDARAFRAEAGSAFALKPDGTNGIFLWTDDAEGAPVICSEST